MPLKKVAFANEPLPNDVANRQIPFADYERYLKEMKLWEGPVVRSIAEWKNHFKKQEEDYWGIGKPNYTPPLLSAEEIVALIGRAKDTGQAKDDANKQMNTMLVSPWRDMPDALRDTLIKFSWEKFLAIIAAHKQPLRVSDLYEIDAQDKSRFSLACDLLPAEEIAKYFANANLYRGGNCILDYRDTVIKILLDHGIEIPAEFVSTVVQFMPMEMTKSTIDHLATDQDFAWTDDMVKSFLTPKENSRRGVEPEILEALLYAEISYDNYKKTNTSDAARELIFQTNPATLIHATKGGHLPTADQVMLALKSPKVSEQDIFNLFWNLKNQHKGFKIELCPSNPGGGDKPSEVCRLSRQDFIAALSDAPAKLLGVVVGDVLSGDLGGMAKEIATNAARNDKKIPDYAQKELYWMHKQFDIPMDNLYDPVFFGLFYMCLPKFAKLNIPVTDLTVLKYMRGQHSENILAELIRAGWTSDNLGKLMNMYARLRAVREIREGNPRKYRTTGGYKPRWLHGSPVDAPRFQFVQSKIYDQIWAEVKEAEIPALLAREEKQKTAPAPAATPEPKPKPNNLVLRKNVNKNPENAWRKYSEYNSAVTGRGGIVYSTGNPFKKR